MSSAETPVAMPAEADRAERIRRLRADYARSFPVPPSHLLAAHLRAQAYLR